MIEPSSEGTLVVKNCLLLRYIVTMAINIKLNIVPGIENNKIYLKYFKNDSILEL
jgi:hypothetical protein